MRINLLLKILVVIFMSSCVEKFNVELDEYEDLLVIEGRLTNMPPPYEVKLTYSSDITNPEFRPLSGARVVISDNEGNIEILTEKENGSYFSDSLGMRGVPGKSYKLDIETTTGKTYTSEFQKLLQPAVLDSVYAEYELQPDINLPYDLRGYRFFLDMNANDSDAEFFFWDLEATYQYEADFKIPFVYDGQITPFDSPNKYRTCWKTVEVPQIFTFDTRNLSSPILNRYTLHYQDTETRELAIRYSLLVKQYSVDENAFRFWSNLKNITESQGSLYSKQPYRVRGNLFNPENNDEPVMGYFMVAGLTQKRIFVQRALGPYHYGQCTYADPMVAAWDIRLLQWSNPNSWPVFLTQSPQGVLEVPHISCVDCRDKGGSIFKPTFWID